MTETKTATISRLNDTLRTEGIGGKVLMTNGIQGLSHTLRADVFQAIREYSKFDADNDPYGEHDFGSVAIEGQSYFFKVDYYGPDYQSGSTDPSDPEVTRRVMTVMRADEY